MSGQRKKPYKRNNQGPSSLDRILDRPCQIHGTLDKPANHTHRSCLQAGKLNAEDKEKGSQSEIDNEEPRPPNIGGQKKFPPSQNGEHDIRYPYPQEGALTRAQGRLCDRASRPKIQSMVVMPEHL